MSLELSHARDYVTWVARKIELNHLASTARLRQIRRGEVYWCEFGLNVGSEMSKGTARPAVVLQNNLGNKKSSNTIVVPITHDSGSGPFLVPITPQNDPNGNHLLDGKANTSNVICISKARLGNFITTLPQSDMKAIDDSLSQMIGLKPYYDKLQKQLISCKSDMMLLKRKIHELSGAISNAKLDENVKKIFTDILDK